MVGVASGAEAASDSDDTVGTPSRVGRSIFKRAGRYKGKFIRSKTYIQKAGRSFKLKQASTSLILTLPLTHPHRHY